MVAPMIVLAVACVVLGLWPQLVTERVLAPALVGTMTTGEPVQFATDGVGTGSLGLWKPMHATVLMLIGILLGLLLVWLTGRKVRVVRPFLCGEVPAALDDRFRVPGTHFYETIQKLPLLGPLFTHGQRGALDLYHWCGKYGHTLVETLRAGHTGLINLYVAWCVVGLIVMLIYMFLAIGI